MLIHDCIPCQHGDHDSHQRIVQVAPKGMMGGQECHCEGECRNKSVKERMRAVGWPEFTQAMNEYFGLDDSS